MQLNDKQIRELALSHGMIEPFHDTLVREKPNGEKVVSYGLSSFGYDARVGNKFKIFTNVNTPIIDPRKFNEDSFVEREADECIIPPNSFVLASTVETFKIPRDILVVCLGKSTYARCGLIVNVTPLEPEWCGTVTLEFSNTTPNPVVLLANQGACQFIFLRGDPCEVSYADRKGKYQNQVGITLPKL